MSWYPVHGLRRGQKRLQLRLGAAAPFWSSYWLDCPVSASRVTDLLPQREQTHSCSTSGSSSLIAIQKDSSQSSHFQLLYRNMAL